LTDEDIEALVERLEANPHALLFRLSEEIEGGAKSHPSYRRRILYLWRNCRNSSAETPPSPRSSKVS
jgi:hypothetical protein